MKKRISSVLLGFIALFFIMLPLQEVHAEEADEDIETECYGYTGGVQTFTVPYNGWYIIELWGAQGGCDNAYITTSVGRLLGGMGSYVSAKVYLNKGEVIYINVGGGGTHEGNHISYHTDTSTGAVLLDERLGAGYNGGGAPTSDNANGPSGGGGGATDVRLGDNRIDSRFMVAGGGGGTSGYAGGAGGTCFYDGISGTLHYMDGGAEREGSLADGLGSYFTVWKYYGQDNVAKKEDGYDSGAGGGGGYYGGLSALDGDVATGGLSFVGSPDNMSKRRLSYGDGSLLFVAGVKVLKSQDFLNRLSWINSIGLEFPNYSQKEYWYDSYYIRGRYTSIAGAEAGFDGYAKISYILPDDEPPVVSVNKERNDTACQNLQLLISAEASENGWDLKEDNSYQYYLSDRILFPSGGNWQDYKPNGTQPETIGSGKNGIYYLFVKQVADEGDNLSQRKGTIVTYEEETYHRFGPYVFDNEPPTGTAKYLETNEMLGLWDEEAIEEPYNELIISDAADNLSGVKRIWVELYDKADPENNVTIDFVKEEENYYCRFNLYTALTDPENIETVGMRIRAEDNAGNVGPVPITETDLGRQPDGTPTKDEDIHLEDGDEEGETIRDAFRIEARLTNKEGNTCFEGGERAFLYIYTFGQVEEIEADMASLNSYVNLDYDAWPNLARTGIPVQNTYLYKHVFGIPLYCEEKPFKDAVVTGYKKGRTQQRKPAYEVKGRITQHIRTILKYK